MRILTYKRTHIGDPDEHGRFGIYDCMGNIRDYEYDAVIGVGGIGREPRSFGIDRKINWIGITPRKRRTSNRRSSEVTFSFFRRWEQRGPLLETLAPLLARRLYDKGARFLLTDYSAEEHAEAEHILTWAVHRRAERLTSSSRSGKPRTCKYRCKPS